MLVRLAEGVVLPNTIEVPIPVRFIFLLLTPDTSLSMSNIDPHEVGRSFSTMMSNPVITIHNKRLLILKYLYRRYENIFMCLSIYNFICRHFTTMSTSLPLGSNFFLQSTTFLTLPSSCPPASGTLKILFPWTKSRVYGLKSKT